MRRRHGECAVRAARRPPGGACITSTDSASQVTLSANAYNSGTADITFKAGSPTGTGPVTVTGGGMLAGEAVSGAVTVEDGGTLDAGIAPATAGTFSAANGVTLDDGATWHVDLAGSLAAPAGYRVAVEGSQVVLSRGGPGTVLFIR